MTNHLSPDEISSLMIRAANDDERRHIDACAECAARLDQFKDALSVFRNSMQRWAGENEALVFSDNAPVRGQASRTRFHPLRWALATAALILLIAIPAHKRTMDYRQLQ